MSPVRELPTVTMAPKPVLVAALCPSRAHIGDEGRHGYTAPDTPKATPLGVCLTGGPPTRGTHYVMIDISLSLSLSGIFPHRATLTRWPRQPLLSCLRRPICGPPYADRMGLFLLSHFPRLSICRGLSS